MDGLADHAVSDPRVVYIPVVDPEAPPDCESAVEVVLSEGWPAESVIAWASMTTELTPHLLRLRLEWRRN
jgi:hypothetical protein